MPCLTAARAAAGNVSTIHPTACGIPVSGAPATGDAPTDKATISSASAIPSNGDSAYAGCSPAEGYPLDISNLGPGCTEDEPSRVRVIRALQLMESLARTGAYDSRIDSEIELLLGVTGSVFHSPAVMVTLIDEGRVYVRNGTGPILLGEFPYKWSFCTHLLAQHKPQTLVVPDAKADARFADNPVVTSAPGIRFYCGAPLLSSCGTVMGSLCFIDWTPRLDFDASQCCVMNNLAELTARLLEKGALPAAQADEPADPEVMALSRVARSLECYEAVTGLVDIIPPTVDGGGGGSWTLMYANEAWETLLGRPREEVVGRPLQQLLELEAESDAESDLRGQGDVWLGQRGLQEGQLNGVTEEGEPEQAQGPAGPEQDRASTPLPDAEPHPTERAPPPCPGGAQPVDAGVGGADVAVAITSGAPCGSQTEGAQQGVLRGSACIPQRDGWGAMAESLHCGRAVEGAVVRLRGRARRTSAGADPAGSTVLSMCVRVANCHVLDAATRMPLGVPPELALQPAGRKPPASAPPAAPPSQPTTAITAGPSGDAQIAADQSISPSTGAPVGLAPSSSVSPIQLRDYDKAAVPGTGAAAATDAPPPFYCFVTLTPLEAEPQHGAPRLPPLPRLTVQPAPAGSGAGSVGVPDPIEPGTPQHSGDKNSLRSEPSEGGPADRTSSGGPGHSPQHLHGPAHPASCAAPCHGPGFTSHGSACLTSAASSGAGHASAQHAQHALCAAPGSPPHGGSRGQQPSRPMGQGRSTHPHIPGGCEWAFGMEPLPGLRLGHLLGKGGYGRVFLANYKGRRVAAKVVSNDMLREARCLNGVTLEALAAQELRHPHIVRTVRCVVRAAAGPGMPAGPASPQPHHSLQPARSLAPQQTYVASGPGGYPQPRALSLPQAPCLMLPPPVSPARGRYASVGGQPASAPNGGTGLGAGVASQQRGVVERLAAATATREAAGAAAVAGAAAGVSGRRSTDIALSPFSAVASSPQGGDARGDACAAQGEGLLPSPVFSSVEHGSGARQGGQGAAAGEQRVGAGGAAVPAAAPSGTTPAAQEEGDELSLDGDDDDLDAPGVNMIDALSDPTSGPPASPSSPWRYQAAAQAAAAAAAATYPPPASGASAAGAPHAGGAAHGGASSASLRSGCSTGSAALLPSGPGGSGWGSGQHSERSVLPPGETWILQEFCNRGTLQGAVDEGLLLTTPSRLHGRPHMPHILTTALEVASAMQYLHARGYVHADLSAVNVLLAAVNAPLVEGAGPDPAAGGGAAAAAAGGGSGSAGATPKAERGWVAKVSDFGLAKNLLNMTLSPDEGPCGSGCGVITHCAPEVLISPAAQTQKSDVYSFGVLLWQMWTCSRPWANLNRFQIMAAVTAEGRPGLRFLPTATPPKRYHTLATRCLSRDPRERPTFNEVVEEIREMIAELPE